MKENATEDVTDCCARKCQLRVLKITPGGERVYINFLRLPHNFEYRFSAEFFFKIHIGKKQWSATILPKPYFYADSINDTVSLNRPFDEKKVEPVGIGNRFWFDHQQKRIWGRHRTISFNGTANIIHVVFVFSDIFSKFRLAAIKKLNPAYKKNKNYIHNPRWQRFIFRQNFRTNFFGNFFDGINLATRFEKWRIVFTKF